MIDNSKLCKFDKPKNKNEPIKIDSTKRKGKKTDDKLFIKSAFGKEKISFIDFVIDITKKQSDKLEKFVDYCHLLDKCVNCNKKINLEFFKSNEYNEIVMECYYCKCTMIDGTKQSKDYVTWFNTDILENYGVSFKDGFPKAVKAEYGTKCSHCGGSHDGGITYFSFGDEDN